jgi:hypothetical protein
MNDDKKFRDWIDKTYPELSHLSNEEIAESVVFPVELTEEEKKENALALKKAIEKARNKPQ